MMATAKIDASNKVVLGLTVSLPTQMFKYLCNLSVLSLWVDWHARIIHPKHKIVIKILKRGVEWVF
jgi:hypothetical protein